MLSLQRKRKSGRTLKVKEACKQFSSAELSAEIRRRRKVQRARGKRFYSEQIGPVELELLDCLRTLNTSKAISEYTGRTRVDVSNCLARLRGKKMVTFEVCHIGVRHYKYKLTPKGKKRFEAEINRGRIPGVSAKSAGRTTWAPVDLKDVA